jgi:hypothetical protein
MPGMLAPFFLSFSKRQGRIELMHYTLFSGLGRVGILSAVEGFYLDGDRAAAN